MDAVLDCFQPNKAHKARQLEPKTVKNVVENKKASAVNLKRPLTLTHIETLPAGDAISDVVKPLKGGFLALFTCNKGKNGFNGGTEGLVRLLEDRLGVTWEHGMWECYMDPQDTSKVTYVVQLNGKNQLQDLFNRLMSKAFISAENIDALNKMFDMEMGLMRGQGEGI